MKDSIFREYDIRGVVGTELDIDEVYNLGCALAAYYAEQKQTVRRVAVGMDVRTHSPQIKQELCRALQDSGLDVVFVGVCTSPMLYFATHTYAVDAGLMITASHNPREYNGIKICSGTHAVWGHEIQTIKHLYKERAHVRTHNHGSYIEQPVQDAYVAWLRQEFVHLVGYSLPMVIDCGNGAASVVMHDIVMAMQWSNVQLLCAEPDGTFPNHQADPTEEKNMTDVRDALKKYNAHLGIGLDGDADRMGAMTEHGELVPGDKLLAVFAQAMMQQIDNLSVVCDINASGGLVELLNAWGVGVHMSRCGHSIIKEHMVETGAVLGGELSCHFFFKDRGFGFDDGIYAAFRLLEVLHQSGKTLHTLLETFPHKLSSPQYRLPCAEEDKQQLVDAVYNAFVDKPQAQFVTIDGVRVTMPYGWGIIRASNTQPVICFRFEADSAEGLAHIKDDFATALRDIYPETLHNVFGA